MHSFLIISNTLETVQKKTDDICVQFSIDTLDQTTLITEKSIGIEDIRNIQKNLSLSPLKSPIKAAIIHNADTMTIDAQNAFLKTLEEPPQNTIILLLGKNIENFLPTIISRCTVISEKEADKQFSPKEQETANIFFSTLPTMSTGEKLKYAEGFGKSKETILATLETNIFFAREQMLHTYKKDWVHTIRQLQNTYALLTNTNANPRLALEHMLLSLSH